MVTPVMSMGENLAVGDRVGRKTCLHSQGVWLSEKEKLKAVAEETAARKGERVVSNLVP